MAIHLHYGSLDLLTTTRLPALQKRDSQHKFLQHKVKGTKKTTN